MRFANILLPTDFSPSSEHATEAALALAPTSGGRIELLHVFGVPSLFLPDGTAFTAGPAEIAAATTHAEEQVDQAVRRLRAIAPFVRIDGQARLGAPGDEILGRAGEAGFDVIVMGTHGRTGLRRLLMGSVTEAVLRRSPIPVLTVRTPEEAHSAAYTQPTPAQS